MPILWQHLFWVFGHPEVYIIILPGMGVVSEVLPAFSRKPLFGYPIMAFSGAAIGFMGFTVWSHRIFTTGLGPIANAAFALTTMAIAVPTDEAAIRRHLSTFFPFRKLPTKSPRNL